MTKEDNISLTYDLIRREAASFGQDYKLNTDLPKLPTVDDLSPYKEIIETEYPELLKDLENHFDVVNADINNGLDHSIWVSVRAGFITDLICRQKGLDEIIKSRLVRKSILSGLMHDVDRHLGLGEEHMIEGEKTAQRFLEKYGLNDTDITKTVRFHDIPEYFPEGSEEYKIIYGSVYDADHLRYGLEREKDFWDMKERKGVKPSDVIHDYQWLYKFVDSWKTDFGKDVCRKYVKYALAIAEHVESVFS